MRENPFSLLVGEYLKSISLTDDRTILKIETYGGVFVYQCEADCCSESWINHISGIKLITKPFLLNFIRSVDMFEDETINEGEENFSGRQQKYDIYRFQITTEQGALDIEMRNSSNMYYSGRINFINTDQYYWNRLHEIPFIEVTEDF